MKEIINAPSAPEAIGPYSHAVKAGSFLFLSGQLAIVKETGQLIDDTIEGQTRQAILNAQTILQEAGSDLKDVVKTTIFLSDINDFAAMNQVYQEFFDHNSPARSAIQVAALPKQAKVEIEMIASLKA